MGHPLANHALRWSIIGLWVVLLLAQEPSPPRSSGDGEVSVAPGTDLTDPIRVELDEARFAEALELARRHLQTVERNTGDRSLEYARALDLLVEGLLGEGHANDAATAESALRAVELKQTFDDLEPAELARSLLLLGRLHNDRGEPEVAEGHLERSLSLQVSSTGPNDAGLIPILRSLGNAQLLQGKLDVAEQTYIREGELIALHRGSDSMDVAGHAYNTALLLIEVGDWEQALRQFQKAANIAQERNGEENPYLAYFVLGIANAQAFLGETTAALESHERALRIARATMRPDHPFISDCQNGIGFVYQEMGDLDAARKAFTDAMTRATREYGPKHEATGRAIWQLARVERRLQQFDDAEAHLDLARRILAETSNPIPGLEARIEYARLLADRQEWDRAVEEMRTVRSDAAATIPDHIDASGWDIAFGELLLQAGRPDDAREVLQAAVDRLNDRLGGDYPGYIDGLSELATAYARTGELGQARQLAASAEALGIGRVRLLIAGLSERQALSFAFERKSARDLLLTLASSGDDATQAVAWDAVIQSRATVLDELARRHRSLAEVRQSIAATEFAEASRRLANLLVRGPSGDVDAFRRTVEHARTRREEAERELARESRDFRSLQDGRDIGLDRIRQILPTESALVAYVAYEHDRAIPGGTDSGGEEHVNGTSTFAAFVLTASQAPAMVTLGSASDVQAAVEEYRVALSDGVLGNDRELEAEFREVATGLRRLVWDPIRKIIGDTRTIFVVPEGELHLVSLATLPDDENGYLIDHERLFHYLSAERDLAAQHDASTGRGLLVVGDPDYDSMGRGPSAETSDISIPAVSVCAEFHELRFERLKNTREEMNSVARRWSSAGQHGVDALSGEDATEDRFKAKAPGHQVLHLATHGFFVDGDCASQSGEYRGFGRVKGRNTVESSAPGSSPLTLSGLVLAGANRRNAVTGDQEDGILTAGEIAVLDLKGTEWAVLSACDTGLGRIRQSEGVFGLRRAFLVAGTRTLIMSLWPVRDEVAMEWMDRLYQARLEESMDTAQSVDVATRSVLNARRRDGLSTHPAIWGAFVASGDWR